MRQFLFLFFVLFSLKAHCFEVYNETTSVSRNESDMATRLMESAPQPTHLIGRSVNKVLKDVAEGMKNGDSSKCSDIKNDALQAYCQRGELACSEFGFAKNRDKFGIPRWVEDFCKSNNLIGDKALDDYYRYGYTQQFKDKKVYDSAKKYSNDQGLRKRWVINYANGYLLKSY